MKKVLLSFGVTILAINFNVAAQTTSVSQTLKSKKDSVQSATINNAVNDPVGTVSKVASFFHRSKNPAPAVQAGTTAPASSAPTVAPASTVAPVSTSPAANNSYTPANDKLVVNNNAGLITGRSKPINNGLIFAIVQCTGDRASQVITITYKISNPNKANQVVLIGSFSPYSDTNPAFGIDANGNNLTAGNITIGDKTAKWVSSELPTGITLKGNVTLINALSTSANLQYFKLAVASQNLTGNGDKQKVVIEERNIPVTWLN